jgi:hypothetical protein
MNLGIDPKVARLTETLCHFSLIESRVLWFDYSAFPVWAPDG